MQAKSQAQAAKKAEMGESSTSATQKVAPPKMTLLSCAAFAAFFGGETFFRLFRL